MGLSEMLSSKLRIAIQIFFEDSSNVARRSLVRFIILGILFGVMKPASSGEMISAEQYGQAVANPEAWKVFQEILNRNNEKFLKHIQDGTNVSVPRSYKEFTWKINWDAQQLYCKDLANALFSRSSRIEFLKPNAIVARDGAAAVNAAINKTFPRCTAQAPDSLTGLQRDFSNINRKAVGLQPIQYLPTRPQAMTLPVASDDNELSYLLNEDYLIQLQVLPRAANIGQLRQLEQKGEEISLDVYSIRYPNKKNGCPDAIMNGWSGPNFSADSPAGSSRWMDSAVLMFDGMPVFVEYGVYDFGDKYAPAPVFSRFGKKGQHYIYARPVHHDLWRDWALTAAPKGVVDVDESHNYQSATKPMAARACVINFDGVGDTLN